MKVNDRLLPLTKLGYWSCYFDQLPWPAWTGYIHNQYAHQGNRYPENPGRFCRRYCFYPVEGFCEAGDYRICHCHTNCLVGRR